MPHPNSKATAWRSCLRPGRLRAVYLRQWLEHDLPSRWLDKPFLIQFGFALALHDRPGDVMHSLSGLRQARRNQARDMEALLGGRVLNRGDCCDRCGDGHCLATGLIGARRPSHRLGRRHLHR